jgi:nicotinamide-nucleotide amidase
MLPNAEGTAPGFALQVSRDARTVILFFLPGVPHEMESMFTAEVLPRLRRRFPGLAPRAPFKIHLFGLWESEADRRLQEAFRPGELAHLGIRVSAGTITVAVYGAPGLDRSQAAAAVEGFPERLREAFRDVAFGEGEATLASALVEALRARRATVALAESCTGGLIASRLTQVSGASEVFHRSWVTYADAAKVELLGVSPATLEAHGAVSGPTVREMALGALERGRSDVTVAVTGVAGPAGGTPEKPVGLVWFGAARRGPGGAPEAVVLSRTFKPPRSRIQDLSAATALDLARRYLEGRPA